MSVFFFSGIARISANMRRDGFGSFDMSVFLFFDFLYVLFMVMQEFCLNDKTFDLWNSEKKKLNRSHKIIYPKPREIRYIKI
ncbi:TPA: hypothetical protein DIC40_00635 [Patescibacteria group bacterium]|nr:hypothetical protein [Candidatus Gracilibacteria bacterium]